MGILAEFFTWWGGNTWGTRLFTFRKGKFIGEDEFGNRYYIQKSGVGPAGVPRRWVIYNGLAEASNIPAEWHGWMHYTFDKPPTEDKVETKPWQKRHRPNYTGTRKSYLPASVIAAKSSSKSAPKDYEPWQPE